VHCLPDVRRVAHESYLRVAKRAAVMASRFAHAKQFKCYHRQLSLLGNRLARIIRDIGREIAGRPELEADVEAGLAAVAPARMDALFLPRPRGAWALAPREFGFKASIGAPRQGVAGDLATKFYPAVSSLLGFWIALFGGGSDGSWRGALGIAQRPIPARMEGEGVLGRCFPSELRMGA
jgi:hypothetical protein